METMTSVDEVLEGILLQDEVKCFFFFFLLIVIGINEKNQTMMETNITGLFSTSVISKGKQLEYMRHDHFKNDWRKVMLIKIWPLAFH